MATGDALRGRHGDGLLVLAGGSGLQVTAQLMEADVAAVGGPRSKHVPDRTATSQGTVRGSVTLGGRWVPISQPWVRAPQGAGDPSLPAYELFRGTELLGRTALERILAGVPTRVTPWR